MNIHLFVMPFLVVSLLLDACLAIASSDSFQQPVDKDRYCGMAAVDLVARRLAVAPTGNPAYERLTQLPVATVADVELALEGAGLDVKTFRVKQATAVSQLTSANHVVESGVGQGILLVIPVDSRVGHYYVLERAGDDEIALIDPLSLTRFTIDSIDLWDHTAEVLLTVVRVRNAS